MLRNQILQFYGGDPLIAWALTFALCSAIAAFIVIGRTIIRERRQRRQEEDFRQSMKAMLGRADTSPTWPRPAGPKGFANDARHRRSA